MLIYAPNHLCTYSRQTELTALFCLNKRRIIAEIKLLWS